MRHLGSMFDDDILKKVTLSASEEMILASDLKQSQVTHLKKSILKLYLQKISSMFPGSGSVSQFRSFHEDCLNTEFHVKIKSRKWK